jgi:hypothetical protein
MYASIPDALRALARKIGADANGRNEEEILNNIVIKLGGTPIRNHGVAGSIDAMTKVVDLDVMHNMTTLNVTPTSEAQTIIPESPVDGYSQVNVAAAPSANLVAKTYEVPLPNYSDYIVASGDNADGYSRVDIAGPSDLSTWLAVELDIDPFENTITIASTSEQLTAAYQGGKTNLYLKIHEVI